MIEMSEATYLSLKWSVSRGRDTYGYNIATLTDEDTRKRYSCNGGGYDMIGTVFAQWLNDAHGVELEAISDRAYNIARKHADGEPWTRTQNKDGLYGMTVTEEPSQLGDGDHWVTVSVRLDGACGLSSIERVAEAIGLTVKHTYDGKGQTTGFMVTS